MSEVLNRAANGRVGTGVKPKGMELAHMDERSVDETLRLIARMPAPEGLEERVKAGLQLAETPRRVLRWPMARSIEDASAPGMWTRSSWVRGAVAAAIALVIVGGAWGIYTRVEPAQSAKAPASPQAQPAGTFSEAGAIRRPLTVAGPRVLQPVPQSNGKIAKAGKPDAAKAHTQSSASGSRIPAQSQPAK